MIVNEDVLDIMPLINFNSISFTVMSILNKNHQKVIETRTWNRLVYFISYMQFRDFFGNIYTRQMQIMILNFYLQTDGFSDQYLSMQGTCNWLKMFKKLACMNVYYQLFCSSL